MHDCSLLLACRSEQPYHPVNVWVLWVLMLLFNPAAPAVQPCTKQHALTAAASPLATLATPPLYPAFPGVPCIVGGVRSEWVGRSGGGGRGWDVLDAANAAV